MLHLGVIAISHLAKELLKKEVVTICSSVFHDKCRHEGKQYCSQCGARIS